MGRQRSRTKAAKRHFVRTDSVSIPSNRCLFCQAALRGQAAEEHIFPRWLLGELGIAGDFVEPTHLSAKDGSIISQRKHRLGNFVEGRVCIGCNTGWMADLEGDSRPLLVDLIHGRRDIWTLATREASLVARWTMTTVAVLNSASNYSTLVPLDHFQAIREGRIPKGACVYGSQIHAQASTWYWLQSATWQVRGRISERRLRDIAARSYKIGLQFGRLLLMAARWDDPGWLQVRWKGVHFLLSAPRGQAYLRDPAEFPANEDRAFVAFMGTLNLLQGESGESSL